MDNVNANADKMYYSHELAPPLIRPSVIKKQPLVSNKTVSDHSQTSNFGDSVQTAIPKSAPALHTSPLHTKDPPHLGRTTNVGFPSPSERPADHSTSVPQQGNPISTSVAKLVGTCWHGPLHIAAQKGYGRIVQLLLKHTADWIKTDSDGRTPLYYAINSGFEGIVATLIQHGARIDQADNQERNALHWAVAVRGEGYDDDGMTPLHAAVDAGFEVGVAILLQHGADLNYKARKN
ncbi:hypothetical protein VPNG_05277 [Cytospora leucostoma]|uniref:Uncharacterized protein n=1 Tax=Cytospora leucostoma TaxID=1230097 RepID=A0A423X7L1_9PEZI|nr:hypothetical protein VPNG_05277 [Cytospora leucostoma]